MRKIVFGLLLAGAAAPALAVGGPHDRNDDSSPRREARADRPARADRDQAQRPANVERPQFNSRQNRPDFQRPQFNAGQSRPDFQRRQFGGDWQRGRPMPNRNPDAPDSVRNWRPRQQQQQGGYVQEQQFREQQQIRERQQMRDQAVNGERAYGQRRYGQGVAAYGQRGYQQQGYAGDRNRWDRGAQSPFRAEGRRHERVRWNRDWRNDRRYDWRERRYRHRSLFHLGLYIDPFGWGYQPYSIGYELRPNYYQQNYWIDPAMYGLPYPSPGTQWVRYWNDALLVDMYTGQVVDSIRGFFW